MGNPLVRMDLRENRRFLYRIRYHGRRIAVEFFHALTDGTGGLTFLLTLAAEYLRLRHGVAIPAGGHVLNPRGAPRPEEMEDSFLKNARGAGRSRFEGPAFHISGTPERSHFLNITTGVIPSEALLKAARARGVSVTVLLTSVLLSCYQQAQFSRPARRARRPVRVQLPVNLRRFYGSKTLRNFATYINVGINTRYGQHIFERFSERFGTHAPGPGDRRKAAQTPACPPTSRLQKPGGPGDAAVSQAPFLRKNFQASGRPLLHHHPFQPGEGRCHVHAPLWTGWTFRWARPSSTRSSRPCVSCGGKTRRQHLPRIRSLHRRAFFTAWCGMGIPCVESNHYVKYVLLRTFGGGTGPSEARCPRADAGGRPPNGASHPPEEKPNPEQQEVCRPRIDHRYARRWRRSFFLIPATGGAGQRPSINHRSPGRLSCWARSARGRVVLLALCLDCAALPYLTVDTFSTALYLEMIAFLTGRPLYLTLAQPLTVQAGGALMPAYTPPP